MKVKKILEKTTSRKVYNQARKRFLESIGEIYCSRCPYHRVENLDHKYYGGYEGRGGVRYPSRKLTSKYPKQWRKKRNKITIDNGRWLKEYTTVTW